MKSYECWGFVGITKIWDIYDRYKRYVIGEICYFIYSYINKMYHNNNKSNYSTWFF